MNGPPLSVRTLALPYCFRSSHHLPGNSRLPQYAQNDTVNIYLFHGDSGQQVLSHIGYPNPTDRAGDITALVNDSWWGDRGRDWKGENISYLFYWVVTPRDQPSSDANFFPQATFTAVRKYLLMTQPASARPYFHHWPFLFSEANKKYGATETTYPDSMSSTSSPSSTGLSSSTLSSSSTGRPTGSVQNGSDDPSFPHWAIAVISVLGFLALLATCVLAFLFICRMRRRKRISRRGSVTSATPMMAETPGAPQPVSPLLGAAGLATSDTAGLVTSGAPGSHDKHAGDDGSLISRSNSAQESGLFSGADAAIMADAFRMALRKPEFMGESPEESPEEKARKEAELLNKELAEEGRDIRSVSSSRGVKVEGPTE